MTCLVWGRGGGTRLLGKAATTHLVHQLAVRGRLGGFDGGDWLLGRTGRQEVVLIFRLVQVFEVFGDLFEEGVCSSVRLFRGPLDGPPLQAAFGLLRVGLGTLRVASSSFRRSRFVFGTRTAFFGVALDPPESFFAVRDALLALGLLEDFSTPLFDDHSFFFGQPVPDLLRSFFDEDDGEVVFFPDGGGACGFDVVEEVVDLVVEVVVV